MISLSKGKDANVLKKRAPYSSAFHLRVWRNKMLIDHRIGQRRVKKTNEQ